MEVRELMTLFQSSGDLLADRRYAFALDLAARGDRQDAIDLLTQAVEIAPGFASAWYMLGDLRAQAGDSAGAISAFRCAQVADPEDRHGAGLRLVRLGAQAAGEMPAGYVRAVFDQYAARFDAALESLAYRAPELLLAAIKRACAARGRQPRFGRVLDLGCGSGLGGAVFRRTCDLLVGVDLSPAMIAQARQKGLYDRLYADDLGAFMATERATAASYDLILAADVLPYVCDLAPIVGAAASLLDAGGLLGFTTETHPGPDVRLGDKLRYLHGEAHVRAGVAASGLTLQSIEQVSTRNEGGVPVPGLMVIAARA
jgi:predicted TPR repeat methyltransferase